MSINTSNEVLVIGLEVSTISLFEAIKRIKLAVWRASFLV